MDNTLDQGYFEHQSHQGSINGIKILFVFPMRKKKKKGVAEVRVQIVEVKRQNGLQAGRLHGRALQSCSELTISRRNSDKLRTRRCCTCCMSSFGDFEAPVLILRVIVDVPQRAPPTTGKHQECGRNDQKGSTGRRHKKGEFHLSQDGLHNSPISDILPDSEFHH
ncbi:uncharacterized protein LOC144193444 [Stigmatopora nigra]